METLGPVAVILVVLIPLWVGLTHAIGERKGRGNKGFLWGLFLGPVGVAVMLMKPSTSEARQARAELRIPASAKYRLVNGALVPNASPSESELHEPRDST